jgi:DNA-binding NarL/FixJ family response regulator
MPLRCLIADDNDLFLKAAQIMLEREGISVVGVASNSGDTLRRTHELHPDVVLLDICLGEDSGFEVARRLVESVRDLPGGDWRPEVILISTHAEDDYAELISASPAIGFLGKPALCAQAIKDMLSR